MPRRTPTQWQQILNQQQASGLRVTDYCRQQQISTKSFYRWRQVLQKSEPDPGSNFMPIRVGGSSGSVMTLAFGGSRLELPTDCDPVWLAQLLKRLSS